MGLDTVEDDVPSNGFFMETYDATKAKISQSHIANRRGRHDIGCRSTS
jgi:hypothetical protein